MNDSGRAMLTKIHFFFFFVEYVVSNIAPFASSLIVQVMTCSDRPEPALRYILNDAVIPISYAGCEGDADGLCGMSTVVETLRNRIEESE